jgi:two-component system NtrC family response regulator
MARTLLIDDDVDFSPLVAEALEERGHEVRWLDAAEQGLELLSRRASDFDVVLLDQCMPRMPGLEFLQELRRREVALPVLLFTGQGTSDVAIRASKLGAFRYLPKPDDLEPRSLAPLLRLIDEAVDLARPALAQARAVPAEDVLPGESEAMRAVHRQIGLAADHGQPVLILGEVGTGKKRAAQAVHHYGPGAGRPLLRINCLEFSDERRLDDELFGCEADVYPDGLARPGVFEQADGGAVLLDHFHLLSLSAQARIARLIQEGEVRRGGRGSPQPVRARVLACTSADVRAALREGRLSWELVSLLEGTTITLPSLRERGEDVLLLAELFLTQTAAAVRWPARSLHTLARQRLLRHCWPGNVRELQGVIRRAVLACEGAEVGPEHLTIEVAPVPAEDGVDRRLPLSRERAYRVFLDALQREPALADRTDAEVFRWLKADACGEDDGLPTSCATFQRYLREARAYYDTHKHTPRTGRLTGRSIVRANAP